MILIVEKGTAVNPDHVVKIEESTKNSCTIFLTDGSKVLLLEPFVDIVRLLTREGL